METQIKQSLEKQFSEFMSIGFEKTYPAEFTRPIGADAGIMLWKDRTWFFTYSGSKLNKKSISI